jgi:hypothetical protein
MVFRDADAQYGSKLKDRASWLMGEEIARPAESAFEES